MNTKYHFSGEQHEYETTLRQFTLDELLKQINKESVRLLYDKNIDHQAMKAVQVPIMQLSTKRQENKDVFITAWELIDVAYNAICATNDFRGKTPDSNELYMLCAETGALIEKREAVFLDKIHLTPSFFFFLWGFSGEQFKMQTISSVFQNAARELYILMELAKKILHIDYNSVVQQETGVTWQVLISSLLLAWFGFLHTDNLEALKASIQWDAEFKEEDFEKVIDRYTADYREIRSSPLRRQIFYTKPFVKTQRRETISISAYLNLLIYEHSIFWVIRDHYKKMHSGEFFHAFGTLYEAYFQELLDRYVEKDLYRRIEENKKDERADWELQLCGYHFIIEQKSSLIDLIAKQQESSYENIEKYAQKTIIKALHQLRSTEQDLGKTKFIKIVLLYEDYLIPEILDSIFRLTECDVENDHYYWIVTIEDMEKLLFTYKYDRDTCSKILEEKIQREEEESKDGKRLQVLFSKYGIKEDLHLKQSNIDHYENAAMKFIRSRMKPE